MTSRQHALKRAFDVLVAGAALALAFPVLLVTAILVRSTTPGPALFRHARVGRRGVIFEVIKFRTMVHRPAVEGPGVTVAGDPRVTQIGWRLRRSKLDELPQLWNVLRGEMSLVGPRPDIPGYADRLTGPAARILDLRPGITGPATLYFRREEDLLATVENPLVHYDEVFRPIKVRMDLQYGEHWTLARDIGYLAVTVFPFLDRWLHLVPTDDGPADRLDSRQR